MQNLPAKKSEVFEIADGIRSDIVVSDYIDQNEGYSVDSALKATDLIWRENNGFKRCTRESKARCILDMLVQGLNPLKNQCAFVPFGDTLVLMRQFTGSIMVAKREDPRIDDIRARVVREGELFEMEVINGLMEIKKHIPTIESMNNPIIAVYALALDKNGRILDLDLMTWADCINTWRQTRIKAKGNLPVVKDDGSLDPSSTHAKYPERMTIKTVIQRLCRQIINTSPNKRLVESAERSDEDLPRTEILAGEIERNANRIPLDFDNRDGEVVDAEFTGAEEIPSATKEHAKRITELFKGENVIEDISGFIQRKINRIREMTAKEADDYIAHLSEKPKEPPKTKPNWIPQ